MKKIDNTKLVKHLFIKFNDINEGFPKIVSTIREHEKIGLNNNGEVIWGQFTSRDQAGISLKHKQDIEQQLTNNIMTKVIFYSRKAELLYEAELVEIYDRDYAGATQPEFVKLLPNYYRNLAGITHITAKNPMIIYSYFRIKGLRPISLTNNINHIYHYDKQVPILSVKGMQALLYVSLDNQYESSITFEKINDSDLAIEGKNLEISTDSDILAEKKIKRDFFSQNRYGVKRDYVAEADIKGRIGEAAEELVLKYEKEQLINRGFPELAEKVHRKSKTEGDGLGYDILSYETDGKEKYIEVKGTINEANIPFPISSGEVQFSKDKQEAFYLYRVYGLNKKTPQLRIYQGNITKQFNLEPMSYLAKLKF
ncbi:hypothetical protein COE14_24625 [Bacillus thuringiensis]|uniref:DUF3883 domain-containing protein n=1 Tax=Bacillus thuringiensis TaxID=1428 RepID=UPI000BF86FC4|nr:DUF3883 domain-containing protein [Bacillus thuringiensis]PEV08683.1 hypothetical protein CN418_23990 [Bacillus thuringiensis]PGW50627.1 hypothetical protein COE14_24625 [Bacillus thuringiensis]